MKNIAVWFPSGKLRKNREDILRLLKGNEAALAEIERGLSLFFAMRTAAKNCAETDTEIAKDLKRLCDAVHTLEGLFANDNQGTAIALFKGEPAAMEHISNVSLLAKALATDHVAPLGIAAERARKSFKPKRGRGAKQGFIKSARLRLVGIVAASVEPIGITASRNQGSPFPELLQAIYNAADIYVIADDDIRDWLSPPLGGNSRKSR